MSPLIEAQTWQRSADIFIYRVCNLRGCSAASDSCFVFHNQGGDA